MRLGGIPCWGSRLPELLTDKFIKFLFRRYFGTRHHVRNKYLNTINIISQFSICMYMESKLGCMLNTKLAKTKWSLTIHLMKLQLSSTKINGSPSLYCDIWYYTSRLRVIIRNWIIHNSYRSLTTSYTR